MNAFATGMNDKQYSITVTTGLINALNDAEIESVLGHELTHIRHPDHSRRFWADLSRSLPGWRPARDWLKRHGDDLRF